ncbi:hypothetical protein ES703_45578 [subsurface metagenome]
MPTHVINFQDVEAELRTTSLHVSQRLIRINDSIDELIQCRSELNELIGVIEALRGEVHHLSQMDLPPEALKYEKESKYVPE